MIKYKSLPCRHAVGRCAESPAAQNAKPKTEHDQRGFSFTVHRLQHTTGRQRQGISHTIIKTPYVLKYQKYTSDFCRAI